MKPAEILRTLQTWPKKQFGQNFLVSERALEKIVEAGELEAGETVVEIGPGLGALTERLVEKKVRVLAIEADRDLAEYVRSRRLPNVTVVTGDALQVDWTVELTAPYKIIANIPYSITSPLLRRVFHLSKRPERVVLLVQKEVALRLTAEPGSSDRGLLTVIREANATAKIVQRVPPGSFYPSPTVDSAVIVFQLGLNCEASIFWPAVEAGFRHKRQTLANSLKSLGLAKAEAEQLLTSINLDPMVRPQVLRFTDWQNLSKLLQKQLQSD